MFVQGFLKTAKADEHAEYEQANAVDNAMKNLPSPTPEKPLKSGSRVVYHSQDRGWKAGPWAHHTKSCSNDEAITEEREKWLKEELKKHKVSDDFHKIKGTGQKAKQDIFRKVTAESHKKFPPHHHSKDHKKDAIGIGDLGRVMAVEKGGNPTYHVTWDKHPDCTWPGYTCKDLKTPPEGM